MTRPLQLDLALTTIVIGLAIAAAAWFADAPDASDRKPFLPAIPQTEMRP